MSTLVSYSRHATITDRHHACPVDTCAPSGIQYRFYITITISRKYVCKCNRSTLQECYSISNLNVLVLLMYILILLDLFWISSIADWFYTGPHNLNVLLGNVATEHLFRHIYSNCMLTTLCSL